MGVGFFDNRREQRGSNHGTGGGRLTGNYYRRSGPNCTYVWRAKEGVNEVRGLKGKVSDTNRGVAADSLPFHESLQVRNWVDPMVEEACSRLQAGRSVRMLLQCSVEPHVTEGDALGPDSYTSKDVLVQKDLPVVMSVLGMLQKEGHEVATVVCTGIPEELQQGSVGDRQQLVLPAEELVAIVEVDQADL
jgi:hypothetical protein